MGGEEAEASTAPGTSRRERLGVPHSSCQHEFGPGLSVQIHVCNSSYRQRSLNHQRTSRIVCLPSSHSFQAYGSKPTRGRAMGNTKKW